MQAIKVAISLEALAEITKYAKTTIKIEADRRKLVDMLYADGVRSSMLDAPKDGESSEVYTAIRNAVLAALPAPARAMVAAGKKAYRSIGDVARDNRSTKCKENVAFWLGQVSSRIRDLRVQLESREKLEESETKRAAKVAALVAKGVDEEAAMEQIAVAEKAERAAERTAEGRALIKLQEVRKMFSEVTASKLDDLPGYLRELDSLIVKTMRATTK